MVCTPAAQDLTLASRENLPFLLSLKVRMKSQLKISHTPFFGGMGMSEYMQDCIQRQNISLCYSIRQDEILFRPPRTRHKKGMGRRQSKESCDLGKALLCSTNSGNRGAPQSHLLQTCLGFHFCIFLNVKYEKVDE